MRIHATRIAGVHHVELDPIRDDRGFFARIWDGAEFAAAGIQADWIQASVAHNPFRGTLRGMHFQHEPHAEYKLVRCTRGRIQDVALDLRPDSPTFRQSVGFELSADNGAMLVIPPGCAHGYLTLEPTTDIMYLTSAPYARDAASGVRHDDPAFGIVWDGPIERLSAADRSWPLIDR